MKFASVIAALVVALSVNAAFAGDGHVSEGKLSKMGFGSMRVMSDSQGMEVRGMGIAVVSGTANSYAFPFNSATASYAGVSVTNNALAAGAAVAISNGFFGTNGSFAGSIAYAR